MVSHNIKGEHLLSTNQYQRGITTFEQEVAGNPDSESANFYYGRFLLGEKHYKKALQYLQKAPDLKPDKADYHFWLGVCYGSLGKKKSEQSSYQQALRLDKKHVQSMIYLGHSQLEAKRYSKALAYYQRALQIWPTSPSAMYNRALILTKLGRKPEALEGWLEYLGYYPSGAMARNAVTRLNGLGNYLYRNYTLGPRTVTVEKIYFQPFTSQIDNSSSSSLKLIGSTFRNMKRGRLQIIVYQLKNKALAKQKALNIKKFLLKEFPNIKKTDIGVSWFDTGEVIKISGSKKRIDESVSFFVSR